jgi:hypothetical protein
VLNLLAAMLNFAMILLLARSAFNLPFRGLKEVTETRDALAAMHLAPRKEVHP